MILQLYGQNYICTYMEVSITFFHRLYFFLIEHEEIYISSSFFVKKYMKYMHNSMDRHSVKETGSH